jgi:hypothetical protein
MKGCTKKTLSSRGHANAPLLDEEGVVLLLLPRYDGGGRDAFYISVYNRGGR